jgi:hypothetical protein
MSNQPQGTAGGTGQQPDSHSGLRLLGLVAVAAGVMLLMAAAFVLSYTGIHVIALSAGVSPRFARIYPGIFDAMLVVACAAILALRGAGLPSRCYAWLTMLVLLAAAAGADTLHATNTKLPHKPAAAAAAIIPWALVLIGFGLLLSMLRHARLRRATLTSAPERGFIQPSGHVEVRQRHGLDDLFGSSRPPYVPPVRSAPPAIARPAADGGPDLAIESDPGHDDPSSDEGHPAARADERRGQPAGHSGNPAAAFSPAPTVDVDVADAPATKAARGAAKRAETGTVPEPRRAPRPKPQAKPAGETKPAAGPGPAVAKPGPAPVAEAAPAPDAATDADPKPGAAKETGPVPEPEAEAEPQATALPDPEAVPEPEAETGTDTTAEPRATAEPEADAEPVAVPVQFDRVRSSPVPPNE